jgi:hypothetical protein
MAKTIKKNIVRSMTPPSYVTDYRSVLIRIFIEGIVVKLLRGLINLKVLIPLNDFIAGISVRRELMTTIKSSQFHGSLR